MLLAFDVGNTNIVAGVYEGEKLVLINRDPTPQDAYASLVIRDKIGEVFAQV